MQECLQIDIYSKERAQCVLWIAEGYRETALQRLLMEEYENSFLERSTI